MRFSMRTVAVAVAVLIVAQVGTPCFAEESVFKGVYEDSLYGGLVGTLVGAACMAFTKKPADHFEYVMYGAASGVILGAAYGLVGRTKAIAEIDNGKLKFAIPTIIPSIEEVNSKGEVALTVRAALIRGTF